MSKGKELVEMMDTEVTEVHYAGGYEEAKSALLTYIEKLERVVEAADSFLKAADDMERHGQSPTTRGRVAIEMFRATNLVLSNALEDATNKTNKDNPPLAEVGEVGTEGSSDVVSEEARG